VNQTNLCAKSTAHDRFQEWSASGVFLQLWQAGVERFDELRGIDWAWLSRDGAMTKAPLGGEKDRPEPNGSGQAGGGKRSLLTEGHGVPIGLAVDGANRHDMKLGRATIESLVVGRPEPTDEQPQGMCLDKGYDDDEVRDMLHEFGFTAHIRTRGEEAKEIARDASQRARRWVVERSHSWMNRFRRILVRWEKKPEHYLAFRAAGLFG
jgi:putative transposase